MYLITHGDTVKIFFDNEEIFLATYTFEKNMDIYFLSVIVFMLSGFEKVILF